MSLSMRAAAWEPNVDQNSHNGLLFQMLQPIRLDMMLTISGRQNLKSTVDKKLDNCLCQPHSSCSENIICLFSAKDRTVMWSVVLSFGHSVCRSVSRITHKHGDIHRPNIVGMSDAVTLEK